MYTKRIQLINYGPIEKIDIAFSFQGDTPKPVVLVGANGSGKSILLSHVVNGLVKAKDIVYPETPEVEPGRIYKFKTNFYIKSGSHFSFGRVDFEEHFFISELTTMRPKQDYSEEPPGIRGTAAEPMWRSTNPVSNDHTESNFNTDYSLFNKLKGLFARNCILYFPSNRFEEPAWLNKENLTAQVEYVDRKRLVDHSMRQAIAISPLQENRNWLFDVLYDRKVPETRSVRVPIPSARGDKPWYIEAERAEIRDHDEGVLKIALKVVQQVLRDNSNVGFRISRRGNRFVGLHGDNGTIVPNIFQLSSGETSLLNLFLSILRDFELSGSQFSDVADIRGIVVVDEVDLHLNTVHQHEVLPNLLRMFANVQFIVTTQSPLFVLGMERVFGDAGFGLYELPKGHQISSEEFSEFGQAYETFSSTRRFFDDICMAIKESQKPVLLTEGETDQRYLKRAAELFGKNTLLESFEIKDGQGSGNLANVWKNYRYPMTDLVSEKILLLFDCDMNRSNDDRGNLFQRTVPFQTNNPLETGIENLFSRSTLEKAAAHKVAFFDIEHEHIGTKRGVEILIPEKWAVNSDEKMNLCDWLCENGTTEDFQRFNVIFELLEEVIGSNSSGHLVAESDVI